AGHLSLPVPRGTRHHAAMETMKPPLALSAQSAQSAQSGMSPTTGMPAQTLYEDVAADITQMIRTGALLPGHRAPSLRRLSRQRRVSIPPVQLAYQSLEAKGVLEARPQSGYYVRVPRIAIREPAPSRPPRSPLPVGVNTLVARVIKDAGAPDLVRL